MQKKEQPILVTRPSLPPVAEYEELVEAIFSRRWLTNCGALHAALEDALANKLGGRRMTLFTNGHLALECCLGAFLPDGGEVITTPFTFVSTTHAIVRSGLTPVFADVEKTYLTLDPDRIEERITEKTRAIVPVHVYGNPCDDEEIERIAKKHGLYVIYDAAHAFGVTKGGQSVALFGDASMFSFHATKAFNTIEGGGASCGDESMIERMHRARNFGYDAHSEEISLVGGNAKMNEFQAAMGLCNLKYFEREIEKRARVSARYRERLSGVSGLYLPPIPEGVKPNHAYFPVLIDPETFGETRESVCARMNAKNIFPRPYFTPLTSNALCYKGQFDEQELPVARKAAEQALTLPLYADLALSDADDVCSLLLERA